MNQKNSLKGFVYTHYGDFKSMADRLGVDVSTATNWAAKNPRNMLRYIPEITKTSGVTEREVIVAVLAREEELAMQGI